MSLEPPTKLVQRDADAKVKVLPTVNGLLSLSPPVANVLCIPVRTVIRRASDDMDPRVAALPLEEPEESLVAVQAVGHLGRERDAALSLCPLRMGKGKESYRVVDDALLSLLNNLWNVDGQRQAVVNLEYKQLALEKAHGFASSVEEGAKSVL